MKKETISVGGVDYIVRTVDITSLPGFEGKAYKEVDVADYELWAAIERAWQEGDYDAAEIDNNIFYYADSEFVKSDPTDEELVDYLRERLCQMRKVKPVSEPVKVDCYAIELDDLGQKQISLLGYTYKGDNWKTINVRGVCLSLTEFVEGMKEHEDYVDLLYQESKEYEQDVTDEQCVKAINHFFGGNPADYYLDFADVTEDTPVGNYMSN